VHFVEESAVVRIARDAAREMKNGGSAFDGGSAGLLVQDRAFDNLDAA
jgi:hypothetical protein